MHRNIRLKANIFTCALFVLNFLFIAIFAYYPNTDTAKKNQEHIAQLSIENIDDKLHEYVRIPLAVVHKLSADSMFLNFFQNEMENLPTSSFTHYLSTYKDTYDLTSLSFISNQRLYTHTGEIRQLETRENKWYDAFMKGDSTIYLSADKTQDRIYLHYRFDYNSVPVGVITVGLPYTPFQQAILSHQHDPLEIILSDAQGNSLLPLSKGSKIDKALLQKQKSKDPALIWKQKDYYKIYTSIKYLDDINLYIIVHGSSKNMMDMYIRQLLMSAAFTSIIAIIIMYILNRMVFNYNRRLIRHAVSQELEYQRLLRSAVESMYDNVFEFDITHDKAGGESTRKYFESMNLAKDTQYHEALKHIAQTQIKEEYRAGYLEMFMPQHVLQAYEEGRSELIYECVFENDKEPRWIRIHARILFWNSDKSVRMITYRKDITQEKEYESAMMHMAQSDSLTGLYNKEATKDMISSVLVKRQTNMHALIMIDIDHFKDVNDQYGHIIGDHIIIAFANRLKAQSRHSDICGRIGGDEYMLLLCDIPNETWLQDKLAVIQKALSSPYEFDGSIYHTSASIGAAIYPLHGTDFDTLYHNADIALYESKENGRNTYSVYAKKES